MSADLYPGFMCIYIYSLGACVRIVSRFSLQKQPEESDRVRLDPTSPNKMKAVIVLLTTAAALACGVPHPNLKEITPAVNCLHKETLNTDKFDEVFVKDLKKNKMDSCEAEFFCQAEKVLSGQEKLFNKDRKCNVDKLVRNLKQYNNESICTIPTKGDEIILRIFLDDLMKCAQKVFASSG